MVELICKYPEIYKVPVELKGNALRVLNSYVLRSEGQTLVIDTGFNTQDCRKSFLDGLSELGVQPKEASLYLTHLHADHVGLAGFFEGGNGTIYMGKKDYEYLTYILEENYWNEQDAGYIREGFPKEELDLQKGDNPARNLSVSKLFPAVLLNQGDTFKIGKVTLECIEVPGHTPGNTCLYIPESKIMFLGDHILYDITPNIMEWPGINNSLGLYLDSLEKIKRYKVDLALPAHRGGNEQNLYERIDQIIEHHGKRLEEIKNILNKNGKLTAYETAARMKWSLHGKTWDTAPKQQKWFATGEARAHLKFLAREGQVVIHQKSGKTFYELSKNVEKKSIDC